MKQLLKVNLYKILLWFRRKTVRTGNIYNMWEDKGWGNRISWTDWNGREIDGHLLGMKKGDEIRSKMESGKIARFVITEIQYCSDPQDMFFGKVKDLGYVRRI